MVALVELASAKRRLRIFHDDDDVDLTDMLIQASDIVIDYIKRPEHGWTASNAPALIQAAVLLLVAGMYQHRGDAEPDFTPANGYLDRSVTAILHRYRDPAVA